MGMGDEFIECQPRINKPPPPPTPEGPEDFQ